MKLRKKVSLIAGIVIIAVLIGTLFTIYFQQVTEKRELSDRLTIAQTDLPSLIAETKDMEGQLTQAESSLDTNQAKFPQAIESIEFGEYIFEIANRCNLTLASLSFPKPGEKKQGSVTYSVVSLSLPVSGRLVDIFEFIDIIRTDARFASTQVKSVNLNVAGGSATIHVDIYGYKGE